MSLVYRCMSLIVDALLMHADPEVSTLNTLNNVQNSLFVPDLGRFLNRRPTYTITRQPTRISEADSGMEDDDRLGLRKTRTKRTRPASSRLSMPPSIPATAGLQPSTSGVEGDPSAKPVEISAISDDASDEHRLGRRTSLSSTINSHYYAVLPHGVSVDDWADEDIEELNDHVRHMLHSRRSKFKRSMKGFSQYVRKRECGGLLLVSVRIVTDQMTALGFFVTLYAFLITIFGLIWVLFLIGRSAFAPSSLCIGQTPLTTYRLDRRRVSACILY